VAIYDIRRKNDKPVQENRELAESTMTLFGKSNGSEKEEKEEIKEKDLLVYLQMEE